MNAKFEKWCHHERDLGHFIDMAKCGDGSYLSSRTFELNELWNAATKDAIQSLEVTPELVGTAFHAMDAEFRKHYPAQTSEADEALAKVGIHYALTAVLNAIKEQSNG